MSPERFEAEGFLQAKAEQIRQMFALFFLIFFFTLLNLEHMQQEAHQENISNKNNTKRSGVSKSPGTEAEGVVTSGSH